jgi:2-dehydropantoate 2-reductase
MILSMLDECCAVAAAAGFPMRRASAEHWRATLTNPDTPLKASMLRDIEGGAPTEGEHVLGDMAGRAAGFDVKTPLLNIARAHVAAYEISRSQAIT